MANGRKPPRKKTRGGQIKSPPFNEADWVDWDHWQTVEEIQNFMNGLDDASASAANNPDDLEPDSKVASQIRRHGLQADG